MLLHMKILQLAIISRPHQLYNHHRYELHNTFLVFWTDVPEKTFKMKQISHKWQEMLQHRDNTKTGLSCTAVSVMLCLAQAQATLGRQITNRPGAK